MAITTTAKRLPSEKDVDLIKGFKRRLTTDGKEEMYKSIYKRLPVKLSSQNFLGIYIMHIIIESGEPLYGSQVIVKIGEMFNEDIWRPSNGTLYPLLSQMVKEGLLEEAFTDKKNNKKMYDITEKGRRLFYERKSTLKPMLSESELFFNKVYKELYDGE